MAAARLQAGECRELAPGEAARRVLRRRSEQLPRRRVHSAIWNGSGGWRDDPHGRDGLGPTRYRSMEQDLRHRLIVSLHLLDRRLPLACGEGSDLLQACGELAVLLFEGFDARLRCRELALELSVFFADPLPACRYQAVRRRARRRLLSGLPRQGCAAPQAARHALACASCRRSGSRETAPAVGCRGPAPTDTPRLAAAAADRRGCACLPAGRPGLRSTRRSRRGPGSPSASSQSRYRPATAHPYARPPGAG